METYEIKTVKDLIKFTEEILPTGGFTGLLKNHMYNVAVSGILNTIIKDELGPSNPKSQQRIPNFYNITEIYFNNGNISRTDGPAVFDSSSGSEIWAINNIIQRGDDAPAIFNGIYNSLSFIKNGVLIKDFLGEGKNIIYYKNGKQFKEAEWDENNEGTEYWKLHYYVGGEVIKTIPIDKTTFEKMEPDLKWIKEYFA